MKALIVTFGILLSFSTFAGDCADKSILFEGETLNFQMFKSGTCEDIQFSNINNKITFGENCELCDGDYTENFCKEAKKNIVDTMKEKEANQLTLSIPQVVINALKAKSNCL